VPHALLLHHLLVLQQQIGVGGGMKGGINIWRALRNNHTMHPAWVHLADKPITEADLPRSIQAAPIPVSSDISSSNSSGSKPDMLAVTAAGCQPSSGLAAGGAAVAVVGVSAVMPAAGIKKDDSHEPEFVL
jgi:hypothetical protein